MWIPDSVVRRRDMAGQLLHDVAGLAVPHMHYAVLWDTDRTRVAHGSGPPAHRFLLVLMRTAAYLGSRDDKRLVTKASAHKVFGGVLVPFEPLPGLQLRRKRHPRRRTAWLVLAASPGVLRGQGFCGAKGSARPVGLTPPLAQSV